MRRAFFLFLIAFVAVASVVYLGWLIGQSLYAMWQDRRLYRELDELELWAKKRAGSDTSSTNSPTESTES